MWAIPYAVWLMLYSRARVADPVTGLTKMAIALRKFSHITSVRLKT